MTVKGAAAVGDDRAFSTALPLTVSLTGLGSVHRGLGSLLSLLGSSLGRLTSSLLVGHTMRRRVGFLGML